MASLGRHRGNFTWALNQYNLTEDASQRDKFAKLMAKYLRNATAEGLTREEITQGRSYPVDEIDKYILTLPADESAEEMSEEEVNQKLAEEVDTTNLRRLGTGNEFVYVYGFACASD